MPKSHTKGTSSIPKPTPHRAIPSDPSCHARPATRAAGVSGFIYPRQRTTRNPAAVFDSCVAGQQQKGVAFKFPPHKDGIVQHGLPVHTADTHQSAYPLNLFKKE